MATIARRGISAATKADEKLRQHGFCILRDVEPGSRIEEIDRSLHPRFAATPFCQGGFYGPRTKRFGGLLKRAPAVESLVQNPAVMRLVHAILEPWCDTVQLNLTQALELHPGAPAQFPHRDQDMWRGPTGEFEYLVNVMWPISPFKAENGATLVWPGSHNGGQGDDSAEPVAIEADPGSAIIFLGSTLHGAGSNHSNAVRRGIIVSYCLGWLKPYENQWLTYPPEVASAFDPELAALVGYQQHRPNLGNYDGQCPSILLGGDPPDHLAAIDALRPDQEGALSEFLRQQTDQLPRLGGLPKSSAAGTKRGEVQRIADGALLQTLMRLPRLGPWIGKVGCDGRFQRAAFYRRGHPMGGPLVLPVRHQLPRSRGNAGGTWHRCRSHDHLSLGAALCAGDGEAVALVLAARL
jgi:hypothetical protein